MKGRRQEILQELVRLQENAKVILNLISDEKIMKKMESMRDSKGLIKFLTEEANVSMTIIFLIFKFIKLFCFSIIDFNFSSK